MERKIACIAILSALQNLKLIPNSCTRLWQKKVFKICSHSRCCGVHWSNLQFYFWLRPPFLGAYTKHFHSAPKHLPFEISPPYSQNWNSAGFLGSVLKQRKEEKKTGCGGFTSLFSQYAILPISFVKQFSISYMFYFLLFLKGFFYVPRHVCKEPNQWQLLFKPSPVFT